MKIAGSSRKDGMMLYGPHYKVKVTVPQPGDEPVIEVKEHPAGEAVAKSGQIPVVRGIASIMLNNLPITAGLGIELLTEVQTARGKKPVLLPLLGTALSGYYVYKIAGNVGRLRRFHGAEHKVIAAPEAGVPLDLVHVQETSRISDRCGTNFAGFYLPAQLLTALLPIPSETLKAVLAMGAAYEGFKLDREKYAKYVAPFYKLGAKAQEYITTAEPEKEEMEAAIAGMKALVQAEELYEKEKEKA